MMMIISNPHPLYSCDSHFVLFLCIHAENPIGDEGASNLAEALKFNHSLEKLDISGMSSATV
jgi:hypothetical protein